MLIEVKGIEEVFHISEPWYIESCIFNNEHQQLDVYVDIRKGARFSCSNCGAENQSVYDIADYNRTWRHLNFLEYPCYIHAELPRTDCQNCQKVHRVKIPWAIKSRSNFTILFDAWIMTLAKDMPMSAISRLVGEHDTQLWRILHYYVDHAIESQDLSEVTMISTDETSSKRGHNYITIFMDPQKKNVIHVTKGKDSSTWGECKKHLESRGGQAEKITEVCMDMSPAFIKGAKENFPKASITFDKFHVVKAVNEAVDDVRRKEQKTCKDLKNTRYVWLKNEKNLTSPQRETLDRLKDCNLDTAKAYRMRIIFQEIFQYPREIAPMVLNDWIEWGLRCRLQPMVDVSKTIMTELSGGSHPS
ncbi:ISL3 family transposase [Bacillus carboniphilus]|uniref:ISL3 family transposase n=1 Tax=Bacillus carboniphilus TaxID=86663 RepID=A0ABY9JTL7_9BACI|nr:ISL3 family transposase [Bacillus carboniphilus]WLR41848.1 ISL3 family transposase [Bacillus carboniphilus]